MIFEHNGSLEYMDKAIDALYSATISQPSLATLHNELGDLFMRRFHYTGSPVDLNKSNMERERATLLLAGRVSWPRE
jgi:hypothetical protein